MQIKTKWQVRMDQRLQRNIKRGVEAVGKQQGAVLMKFAKQSMRKAPKKGGSQPGQPPRWRTKALRNFILFAWDDATQSVVIGPKRLPRRIKDQPTVLEQGGAGDVFADPRTGERRRVFIKARPYMVPALEKARSKLPALYRNAFTR